jgi:hypothetical protein
MEVLASPCICWPLNMFVFLQINILLQITLFEEACNSSIFLAGGLENSKGTCLSGSLHLFCGQWAG